MNDFGIHVRELVGDAIFFLAEELKDRTGFDTFKQPDFWENWIALQLSGETTAHKEQWDVSLPIGGSTCRIEVKFSSPFWITFAKQKGRDYSRYSFKWGLPRGNSGKLAADCVVLIGLDNDSQVYYWALPLAEIKADCPSITVATPSARIGGSGQYDRWLIPTTELLPVVIGLFNSRWKRAQQELFV